MVRPIAIPLSLALFTGGCLAELVGYDAGGYDAVLIRGQDTTVVVSESDLGIDASLPVETPAAPRMIDGLEYRVEVDSDGVVYESRVRLTTWVRNPATQPAEILLRVCAFQAQVHRRPARSGPSLWPPAPGPSPCPPTLITRVIPARDSIGHAEYVYPEALPDGRYYLSIRATLPSGEYRLDAGSADLVLSIPGLEYQVRLVAHSRTELAASVHVTNGGLGLATISHGGCPITLWLYDPADLAQAVDRWPNARPCQDYVAIVDLAPGQQLDLPSSRHVLGGLDVELGEYLSAVVFIHNGRLRVVPAGPLFVW